MFARRSVDGPRELKEDMAALARLEVVPGPGVSRVVHPALQLEHRRAAWLPRLRRSLAARRPAVLTAQRLDRHR